MARVADLECSLEDALRLKREVETQAEIIRVLTRRVEEEWHRAERKAHPLGVLRSKLIYRAKVSKLTYRAKVSELRYHPKVTKLEYHTKVAVYREIQSAGKWRSAAEGRYLRKATERVPVNRSAPGVGPGSSDGEGKPFEVESSSDAVRSDAASKTPLRLNGENAGRRRSANN
ncbi:MAG TPA: hypothetical protein VMV06_04175 [Acidimicrobiales bacterium]|nr:hypothetical protein [Acidimicrobiales bacterium]